MNEESEKENSHITRNEDNSETTLRITCKANGNQ